MRVTRARGDRSAWRRVKALIQLSKGNPMQMQDKHARVAAAFQLAFHSAPSTVDDSGAYYQVGAVRWRRPYRVASDGGVSFARPESVSASRQPDRGPMATIHAMDALPQKIRDLDAQITVIRRETADAEAEARAAAESELLTLARELAQRETIPLADAVVRAAAERPELAARYISNIGGRADLPALRTSQAEPSPDPAAIELSQLTRQRATDRGLDVRAAAAEVADERRDLIAKFWE